jgi:hypothetical protein
MNAADKAQLIKPRSHFERFTVNTSPYCTILPESKCPQD